MSYPLLHRRRGVSRLIMSYPPCCSGYVRSAIDGANMAHRLQRRLQWLRGLMDKRSYHTPRCPSYSGHINLRFCSLEEKEGGWIGTRSTSYRSDAEKNSVFKELDQSSLCKQQQLGAHNTLNHPYVLVGVRGAITTAI